MKTVSKIEEFKFGQKYAMYSKYTRKFERIVIPLNINNLNYTYNRWEVCCDIYNSINDTFPRYKNKSMIYDFSVWKEIEPTDTDELIKNYTLTAKFETIPNTSKNNHRLNT